MKKEGGLYRTLSTIEPPQGLYGSIMSRIDLAKRRAAKTRAGLSGLVAILSGAALVPVAEYTAQQFYASGFYDYLSLLLSDHTLVMTYWREFGLSLVESLPSLAILLFVPIAVALVWSLMRLVKNVRTLRYA
ncbi:MAG TPA: hypothetical protein VN665_01280 [Candidatus Paceibacterota bacterium]|nr:hypothetical protein [Candidatus Paceibacterota bacterium]